MYGFIADCGSADTAEALQVVTPAGLAQPDQVHRETRGVVTWGGHGGDINYVRHETGSDLILSGYLSEIRSGPDFRDQAEAAKVLLRMLDAADSDSEIGAIATRLHGSFGIFYRNPRKREAVCVADRVASRPLWCLWCGGRWLVSSHPTAIALVQSGHEIDLTALGAFLIYGAGIDSTRSLFAGVHATRAGTITQLRNRSDIDVFRWYQFNHRPDRLRSADDWVELIAERLVTAAARLVRQNKNMVVFFSGGVDSRVTAAALKAAGGHPLLVTLGDGRNLEVRVASLAARALGLQHDVLFRDPEWYLRALPRAVYETGAGYLFTHGHFSGAVSKLNEAGAAESFLLGDLCEAFSKLFCAVDGVGERPWTPQEFLRSFDQIRLPLYRPTARTRTVSLLRPEVRRQVEAAITQEILARYRETSDVSNEALIVGDYCFRWESAPTLPTFYMFVDLRSVASERNVMMDPDVLQLLEILPAAMRARGDLGARVIHRLQRMAAWVPNSNTLLPLCWPRAAHKMSRRVKPILGKARRRLWGDSPFTTGSWPKHAVLYLRNDKWRSRFHCVLDNPDLFDREIFDRDAVRKCWREFRDGDQSLSADVEKLVQLGLTSQLLQSGWTRFAVAMK